ncbi:MAG: hypothetical protein LDL07_04750 [Desulfarculus sp.]|nr:hypothetical protein [Desulfarculus sp.]
MLHPHPWRRRRPLAAVLGGVGAISAGSALAGPAITWGLGPGAAVLMWQIGIFLTGISLLGLVLAVRYSGNLALKRIGLQREALALRQITIIRELVQDFANRHGRLPESLQEAGLTPTFLVNPWGQPYVYVVEGGEFSIVTQMPAYLYDYFSLEEAWLDGPGRNLLSWDQGSHSSQTA